MFDQRLIIVAGKGGVGRSTITAGLALAAAERGRITLVAEVAGQSDVQDLLETGTGASSDEAELLPGLHHVTIDQRAALREYLDEEVPGPLTGAILARSHLFELFVNAAPGLNELLTIGKIWELVQRPRHRRGAREYDLVILDAPASGQLIGLLEAPETFASIARTGPVARQAEAIQGFLRAPDRTGFLGVVTPEQMPVTETLNLDEALERGIGRRLDALVLNRVFPTRFTAADAKTLVEAADDPAVRSALWFHGRTRAQQSQRRRLERDLSHVSRRTTLPFLFTERLTRPDLERFGAHLARTLT